MNFFIITHKYIYIKKKSRIPLARVLRPLLGFHVDLLAPETETMKLFFFFNETFI